MDEHLRKMMEFSPRKGGIPTRGAEVTPVPAVFKDNDTVPEIANCSVGFQPGRVGSLFRRGIETK